MTDEPAPSDSPHNLWEPVDDDDDHGARGAFGDRARSRSYQLWASTHPKYLLSAGLAILTFVGAALTRGRWLGESGEDEQDDIDSTNGGPRHNELGSASTEGNNGRRYL